MFDIQTSSCYNPRNICVPNMVGNDVAAQTKASLRFLPDIKPSSRHANF